MSERVTRLLVGRGLEEGVGALKDENLLLKQQLESLSLDKRSLERAVNELKARLSESDMKVAAAVLQATRDAEPRAGTWGDRPYAIEDDDYQARAPAAFELLGLPPDANSGAILQRYESLKDDHTGLLNNCPKGLMQVCLARLHSLEVAFELVFPERKKEEDKKLKSAYELLQLPEETILAEVITERYGALKTACLKAMRSSDPFVKTVAAEELAKLEEAYRILMPKTTPPGDDSKPSEPVVVEMNTTVAHIFEQTKGDKLSPAIDAGKRAYSEEKRKTESTS